MDGSNKKKLILHIEDDLINMNIIRKSLSEEKYQFQWSGMGVEGITMAKRLSPDLVLVDINLPDITGVDVIKKFRTCDIEHLRKVPIFAITGLDPEQIQADATKAGANLVIYKPVDIKTLKEQVEAILGESA